MSEWLGPIVHCREVTKLYPIGDGLFALKDVDFRVDRGQFVAIAGPSGSGKSTLLNIMGGIDRPTYGDVVFMGKPYRKMTEDDLALLRRNRLGMVFQFFNLIPELTAAENIAFPMRLLRWKEKEVRERQNYLLEAVGLGKRADHFPEQLSGGEEQRVAIARALAVRPDLILADEPTGNLDSAMSRQVMELFRRFNKEEGQTFVVVSHGDEIIDSADVVIRLVDGEIVERSTRDGKSRP